MFQFKINDEKNKRGKIDINPRINFFKEKEKEIKVEKIKIDKEKERRNLEEKKILEEECKKYYSKKIKSKKKDLKKESESDKYKICIISHDKDIFKNKKFIYIQFNTQLNEEIKNKDSAVKKDFQIVDDTMSRINTKVDNIENMQGYQIKVEDNFSEKQINSSSRLALLSICQIIVICIVGVYHVFYLRKIFKDKIWTPF